MPVTTALRKLVTKLVCDELVVTAVREHGPRFRSFELAGPSLRGAQVRAGDKVQVMLDGGPRTYTPFGFDRTAGTMQLLAYLHGDAPGSSWARALTVGQKASVFGPRGSLPLTELDGPVVIFGDETSLALTLALASHRGGTSGVRGVFEVDSIADTEAVLGDFELVPHTLVERQAGDAHFERVDRALRFALEPASRLVLTGRAQSIQAVRASLRDTPAVAKVSKTKAYWAVGKRGLD